MGKTLRTQLWFQVVGAMVIGLAVGLLLSPSGAGLLAEETAESVGPWIAFPGNLFLALIKMVVIPLVLSSIVLGLTSTEDSAFLKKALLRILPYFVGTTVVAVAIGIGLTLLIQPGKYIASEMIRDVMEGSAVLGARAPSETVHLSERLLRLMPTNYVQSVLDQDMLATVILALFIGVALTATGAKTADLMKGFFEAVQEISLTVIDWAMRLAPVAVFGLICNITMRVGFDAIAGMAAYVGTVLGGLALLLVFYLVLAAVLGKTNPLRFLARIREVQLLAFSTSSSAAVMPFSMQTAEDRLGVAPSVSRFIVPLGATINMDGTALYQVSAAIFLAQVYGVQLGFLELATLAATTVGASIGTPSTPGVGIVILATILQGIGIPPSGIALIIGVDRILDMSRTAINVTGDLTACTIMNRWLRPPEG